MQKKNVINLLRMNFLMNCVFNVYFQYFVVRCFRLGLLSQQMQRINSPSTLNKVPNITVQRGYIQKI